MNLEIRELDEWIIRFVLSGVTPAFANSLRRAIQEEVPALAIDEVDFEANDSVMDDEILAHRLGQIPLRTPEGYRLPEDCDCEDGRCSRCSVSLTLDVEGPGVIRAGQMESPNGESLSVSDSTRLTRLDEGQRLKFMAIARLGFGKDHANWQPAVSSYKYMPVFNFDEGACSACGDCVEACPLEILELIDDLVEIVDVEQCTMCKECVASCPEGAVEISYDSSKFIFKVESTGCMPPEKILSKSTEVLMEKCNEFAENLEGI